MKEKTRQKRRTKKKKKKKLMHETKLQQINKNKHTK